MLVRWKVLFILGFALWITLCVVEHFFQNVIEKNSLEDRKVFEVHENVEDFIEPQVLNESTKKTLITTHWLFWNVAAFFTSILCCFALKTLLSWKNLLNFNYTTSETTQTFMERMVNKTFKGTCSSSKIPILISKAPSILRSISQQDCDFQRDVTSSCFSLSTVSTEDCRDIDKRSEISQKSEPVIKETKDMADNHCANLRNEVFLSNSNYSREQAILTKKIDQVSKEKRELSKQLTVARKENRSMKLQLDEMLSEKKMLIKRLDSAAREFKINIKSKKAAMERLEQAEMQIQFMTEQLEASNKMKTQLDRQLKDMEVEVSKLNDRMNSLSFFTDQNTEEKNENTTSKHSLKKESLASTKEEKLKQKVGEVSENRVAVQKVQMRLSNLEKSLERFREHTFLKKQDVETTNMVPSPRNCSLPNSPKNDGHSARETSKDVTEHGDKQEDFYSEVNDFLNRTDNLTDEQRQEILRPLTPKLATTELEETFPAVIEFIHDDEHRPQSQVDLMLSLFKAVKQEKGENRCDFFTDDETLSLVSTSVSNNDVNEDEQREDLDSVNSTGSRRIVSSSPAFQKFLRTLDGIEKRTATILNPIF